MRGFEPHDHGCCIAEANSAAEQRCATRSLRLTAVRRQVLEILLQKHVASGAYDTLEHLHYALSSTPIPLSPDFLSALFPR